MCKYFSGFTRRIRINVKFIVMDMFNQFKCIMERLFPNAHIVGEQYHIAARVVNFFFIYIKNHINRSYTRQ
ncbi:transposase [Anaeroglobus geminatus]|uniref:transposase n=1 Tax=Anaeroglobus geminatus TaxID=156456 RepID=UPI0008FEF53B